MFLSHILAIASVVLALALAIITNDAPKPWPLAIELVALALLYATYKFARSEWIWIGPTSRQMAEELERVLGRIAVLDQQIFPQAPRSDFAPASPELKKERTKLLKRRDTLEDLIRSHAVNTSRRPHG